MAWGNTSLTSTILSKSKGTGLQEHGHWLSSVTQHHTLSFVFYLYFLLIGSYRYLLRFSKPRHCPAHGCEESIQIFAIHILCGKPMSSESLAWSLRERWLHSEFRKWVQNSAQFSAPPSATRQHTVVFCICLQSVVRMTHGTQDFLKSATAGELRETCLRRILSCRTKDVPQWLCHCRRSWRKLTKLLPSLLSKRIDEPWCN